MAIVDCTCAHCGAVTLGDSRKRYCSSKCKWAARDLRRPRAGRQRRPRGPFTCKHCSTEYITRRPAGEGESYCGRACAYAAQKQRGGTDGQVAALAMHRLVRSEVVALTRIADAWAGRRSLYSGCSQCGRRFRKVGATNRCRSCVALPMPLGMCVRCGGTFERGNWSRHCSDECHAASQALSRKRARRTPAGRAARKRAKTLRRARKSIRAQNIDPVAVFRRDKWRCHVCGGWTPERLRGTFEPNAPELDHVITLADGGEHTWGNVACACRSCNIAKGARSFGQLGLGWAV